MKKYILFSLALFLAAGMVIAGNQKVPDDIAVRATRILLDQSRIQNQITQLQIQYQTDMETIKHDASELESIKKEALATAKLDPAGWDVDFEKLEFVGKPAVKK